MTDGPAASRRILVVGGVAGGMSFAARARRLDEHAEIVVFERGAHPSFANCGLPYFVSGEIERERSLLVQTPESLRAALNLDVRVEHDVIAIDVDGRRITVRTPDGERVEAYDELVLAPGAVSLLPDVPGIIHDRVQVLRTVADAVELREHARSGGTAVVIGGGYIGLEAAEALRSQGLETHLVHHSAHVLSRLERELASAVHDELVAHGVELHMRTEVAEVHDAGDAVRVLLPDDREIVADVVVVAAGTRPDTDFVRSAGIHLDRGAIIVDDFGRTSAPHVWAVGDAVTHTDPVTAAVRPVALAGPANRDGRLLADAMLGDRPRPRPAALGTSIVRVFGLAVAMTGANRAELDAANVDYATVHLHAGSHAGYFPGAEPVHLVVVFGTDGELRGRLLGAQAVGRDGVDKRIDVLATAIRGGLQVADLIDLDLAYAPPFGSAKDPITMAGLVADNVLTGVTRLWYPWELERLQQEAVILDVRRDDEWSRGHLPGALHIPHTELRERIDEVRATAGGRFVAIHCASGVRSYLAHRMLAAAGIASATLSGGMQTLLGYHGKDVLRHEEH